MNLRIHYVLPLCLLFACDKVERDWSKCSETNDCKKGFTCSRPSYLCVPVDAGADAHDAAAAEGADASSEAGGRETASADSTDAPLDVAVDVDVAVTVDVAEDVAVTDAAADAPADTRPVDAQGSCSSDIECPASAPLCLDFMCAKCTSANDCAGRGDGGAGAGVCEPTSGRCVACVKSSECTADPARPVCVANQCAACTTNSQCSLRGDGGVSAGVCDTTTGRCVACVQNSECTSNPAKPICVANQCAPCQSATSPANECRAKSSGAPVCDQGSGKCVGCLSNDHCMGSTDGGVDNGEDGGMDGGADGGVVAGFCYLTTNQCVECLAHTDCKDPTRPICGSLHACVGCGLQPAPIDGCATKNPALPVCKADTGTCVECTGNSNCTGDAGIRVCNPATNKCVECNDNTNCTADPANAFCVNHACAGCQTAGTGACTGAKPMCATTGGYVGQCVECIGNTDCTVGTKPVCATNQCRGCKKDLDCTGISPALVCGLDGSCPGDSSVIYLQNSATCSTASRGDGSAAAPFCYADDAAAALSVTKSVIVARGTVAPLGPLAIALSTPPVLIAGKASATLRPPPGGSPPVIAITAGDVTLRDLTISNGNDAGVSVSGGATLRMDRCYVLNNAANGIITANSAFDIANTVVAGNGTDGLSSGVGLGSYTGSGPKRFWFNTVVNNGFGGVVCGASYTLTGILANGNGTANFSSSCAINGTTSTAAPNFGTNYHLTATSPCKDTGGTTCPPDDIDGDTRPKGTACDCGADEY